MDVLAAIGTIGGVSMMIGLGVASISYAFQILFGIELGATGKFSIMLCFILTYIISTSTGLARGMRYLSESNGYITLGLLFAVLILGATPFTYVINMLMQVAGEFLFRLPQNLLWMPGILSRESGRAHGSSSISYGIFRMFRSQAASSPVSRVGAPCVNLSVARYLCPCS